MVRCTNPECRLEGLRVRPPEGEPYTCECGEVLAREALGRAKP